MATATKIARTLLAPTSNPAGSTTQSAVWNLTTSLGGVIQTRVSNGATGPSAGCESLTQVSSDGTTWRDFARQIAGTGANGVFDFFVEVPGPVLYARVQFSGNTGQAVTVEAYGHELTSIG
jgi:hypothetical protein